jgi:hypothetical protein
MLAFPPMPLVSSPIVTSSLANTLVWALGLEGFTSAERLARFLDEELDWGGSLRRRVMLV